MTLKGTLHILLILNCLRIVKCSSLDACVLHHVNITSEPVTITSHNEVDNPRGRQAITNECTLDLYVQEGNALFVEILNSTQHDAYSYLYFEQLNSSNSQCLKRYTLTSLSSTPCKTFITYTACKVHIRNTLVTIKVKGISVAVPGCMESGSLSLPWLPWSDNNITPRCEMSAYDYESFHPSFWNTFPIKCPRKCECNLDYRKLSILCNDVTSSAEILVVYDQQNDRLSFKEIGLTTISSNALLGIRSVNFFYFNTNRLTTLNAGTFKGLSQVFHLALDNNHLSFLPATLFHDLVKLKSLYLTRNQLSDLPLNIFQNLPKLLSLRLAENNLTTLGYQHIAPNNIEVNVTHITSNSILNGLVDLQYLDLTGNMLTYVDKDIFDGLVELRFLRLSYNPLHMLPGDTLSAFKFLRDMYLRNTQLMSIPTGIFHGTQLTTIDLSHNQLTTLPSSIFHDLIGLTVLTLSSNSFYELPDGLFRDATEILKLDLDINKLQWLPNQLFDGMFDLYELLLHHNELTSLPRGIFKDLISLEFLYLNSNRLKLLPADAFHGLSQLTNLVLYDNELIAFPVYGTFHRLQNLRQLSLNSNNLTSLSAGEFRAMFQLQKLFIENNKLVFLSNNSFADLSKLTELYLGYNKLSTLPQGVFEGLVQIVKISLISNLMTTLSDDVFIGLHGLEWIEMTHNRLKILPKGVFTRYDTVLMSNGSSLNELYLGGNQLEYLPAGIFNDLNMLTHLHIYNNNLTILPNDSFQDLFELFELDLSNNYLATFAEGTFQSLTNVNNFFIERNHITDLPLGVFNNMTSVTYLDISHNRLTSMHRDVFQSLNSMQFLNLSYNHLYQLPRFDSLTNLQVLDASFNQLPSLNPNIFRHNTEIIYISLDSNAIVRLPVNIFQNLQNLQVLTWTNNLLNTLSPGVFGNLSSLLSLNLSNNYLSDISSTLWGLSKLEHLEIQNNKLHTLPAGIFEHCKNLKFVNFSTNSINTIGRAVLNGTNIQTLDLRSNDLYLVTKASFTKLQHYTVLADKSATCCFVDNATCISKNPRPVYLTCKRILNGTLLQISMWSLGLFTIVFNMMVFCIRCLRNQSSKIQELLITHLSLSDFLMGVNMLLLAAADVVYGDYFPSYSDQWRNGPICKVASILSILSSELSVFFVTLISFDRFQGVKYPFGSNRLRLKIKICISMTWCVGLILSVVPTALSGVFPDVYEVSEVCVGIPIVKRPVAASYDSFVEILVNNTYIGYTYSFDAYTGAFYYNYNIENIENLILSPYTFSKIVGHKLATYFSLIVFIRVNLVCFGLVAYFYVQIFIYARKTIQSAGRKPDEKQEIRKAMKMSVIVLTDFCTWVPLLLVCILAQSNVIKVNPLTYAWTVAFILPINSAINPFLYTLIMLIEARNK